MMPQPTPPDPELLALMTGPEATGARVILILITAGLLALAVVRARKTLIKAIEAATQRANLSRTLPSAVADRVASEGADGLSAGEVRTVAVLFADIRDFSRQVENLPPALIAQNLARFRRLVIAAVERHGGIVDKFIGDGAMAVFGALGDTQCGAKEAIAAACDLIAEADAADRDGEDTGAIRLRIGVGVHAGPALVGAIGDHERMEFTVLGDTVNVAAHLEAETKEFATPVLVSVDCLDQAEGGRAEWTVLPPIAIAGRRATLALARLATTRYDWPDKSHDREDNVVKAVAGQAS